MDMCVYVWCMGMPTYNICVGMPTTAGLVRAPTAETAEGRMVKLGSCCGAYKGTHVTAVVLTRVRISHSGDVNVHTLILPHHQHTQQTTHASVLELRTM